MPFKVVGQINKRLSTSPFYNGLWLLLLVLWICCDIICICAQWIEFSVSWQHHITVKQPLSQVLLYTFSGSGNNVLSYWSRAVNISFHIWSVSQYCCFKGQYLFCVCLVSWVFMWKRNVSVCCFCFWFFVFYKYFVYGYALNHNINDGESFFFHVCVELKKDQPVLSFQDIYVTALLRGIYKTR